MKIIKSIALILSWVIFSPLFLILTYRWEMLRKWLRWLLALVSPFFLILYIVIVGLCMLSIELTPRDDKYFSNEKRLERITGVRFEVKKVVDYRMIGKQNLRGDYTATTKVLLKRRPDYNKLDSLSKIGKWQKTKHGYSFYAIWGNGLDAPEGEDSNRDKTLDITVITNCDTLYITSGTW